MWDGASHSRVYLLRSPSERFVNERFADAAVAARNQDRPVRNVHNHSPCEPQLGGSESLQFRNVKNKN
jgi:hypothetical protein